MIIGIVGFIGSGKGTVGSYLVKNHDFSATSFAKTLKDATAAIFNWPRDLLEGDTEHSREWREQTDPWWSKKFGRPITPRWVLQYIGTDVMRMHFNSNIWIWSVEKQIVESGKNTVITDVRFPNEIKMIEDMGGKVIWVRREKLPEWYGMAQAANDPMFLHAPEAHDEMVKLGVHPSEWAWVGCKVDYTIHNDGTLDDLYGNVDRCLKELT
jgi:hypothetical protein